MLISENIEIKINNTSVKHYNKLGYNVKNGDIITIPVEHLTRGSHYRVKVKCDVCGEIKTREFKSYYKIKDDDLFVCNKTKCKQHKIKQSNLKKYGVEYPSQLDYILEKNRKTNLEKYGVEYGVQSEIVKEKTKHSLIERYRVDNYLKTNEYKEKLKRTSLEKYSTEHPTKNDKIKNKIKNTKKKNTFNRLKHLNIIDIDENYNYVCKCENGHTYKIDNTTYYNRKIENTIICTICNPINSFSSSGYEIQLQEFIKNSYNGEILLNYRGLINKEIDIYLPELKLAFEFNGLYWHSDLYLNKYTHQNKTNDCRKLGIKLIHIYEDDWIHNQDKVKGNILNILNIENIDIKNYEIKEKYDNNIINIELYQYKNLINSISIKKYYEDYEISSYYFLDNVKGFNIIFQYFIKKYNPKIIKGLYNKDNVLFNLYEYLNFKLYQETEPNMYFINKKSYKRKRLKTKPINIDEYLKIYDSGNILYKWNKNQSF